MAAFDVSLIRELRVLYVEDDKIVREKHEEFFSKIFKKTFIACDGREGLELFLKNINDIDIIITDINLPYINGLDLAKEIKQKSSIPIIIIAGNSNSQYAIDALDIGIRKYHMKPISLNAIIKDVEELVLEYKDKQKKEELTKVLYTRSEETMKKLEELIIENKKLKQKDSMNRYILDNYVSTFSTDSKGNILETSKYFSKIMQMSEEELIAKDINNFKDKDCDCNIRKKMLLAIKSKGTIDYKCIFITKKGLHLDFDVKMVPFYSQEELVDGYHFYLKSSLLI